jgi:hypothetical protein
MEPLELIKVRAHSGCAGNEMADLAAKEAARNIDEASVTLTHGDVPWYDKTHWPFTQNDEQQGQQQVQQGNTTPTTQTAPAAPGATATQTEGGTRTRALRNTTDAIRQHMHTVHHLGASNTSTIYYHHYSQLGRVADGSSAMPS